MGTHKSAKRKREELSNAMASMRKAAAKKDWALPLCENKPFQINKKKKKERRNTIFILKKTTVHFSSIAQSCPTLQPHGLQHARLPCPSPTPESCSNLSPLSQWCHPTISSSVIPFSSHLQSFPASESFPLSQLFASGGQSFWASASASVLPMNVQDWFSFWLTGLISLQSKNPLWHFNLPTYYPPTSTSSAGMRMVVQILVWASWSQTRQHWSWSLGTVVVWFDPSDGSLRDES